MANEEADGGGSPLQVPRGTRDFGPAEMAERRRVEGRMRETLRRYGYREVQTPTFENLELFTAKSGPAILDELYGFEDKSGRRLALRPELTAAVMRFYYASLAMEPKPLKLYYFGNCFRYDRPQKGRYREFWQMGCELIGPETPEALGEMVALGAALLQDAGVARLAVRIGHLHLLYSALDAIGWPSSGDRRELLRRIDKWDERNVVAGLDEAGVDDGARDWFLSLHDVATLDDLAACLDAAPRAGERAEEAVARMRTAASRIREVLDCAAALGLDLAMVRIDPLIARGLDYYTGVVLEVDAPALGAEKQLLGGGQYDLSGVFGGEPVATCGFALGFDRALVAVAAEGAGTEVAEGVDAYVAPIGDAARRPALVLAAKLRRAGLSVEVDLMQRTAGKNLKAAASRGARVAVILGGREVEGGFATVKDLASGEQVEVPLAAFADWLSARPPASRAP